MTRIGKVVLCAVLIGPTAAMAESSVFVDGYFLAKSTLNESGNGPGGATEGEIEDSGYGGRALATFAEFLAVTGEYQTTSYDDVGEDLAQTRAGIGLILPSTTGVFVEYNKHELGTLSLDGFAVHVRVAGNSASMQIYADLGWAMLTEDQTDLDYDGLEFTVGGAHAVTETFGVFLDYRTSALEARESGSNLEYRIDQFRLGVRAQFGL
jgi:hypothetical protein